MNRTSEPLPQGDGSTQSTLAGRASRSFLAAPRVALEGYCPPASVGSAVQLYGAWLCNPQKWKCELKTHVCAMHGLPFLHSSSCLQSWAAAWKPDPGAQLPPFATAWQTAAPANVDVFSSPQQLLPAGHSHEYWQWNGDAPLLHVAAEPATHTPVGVGRAGVTQQVFVCRSHGAVPLQAGAV
jgi:hypothetical protein